jgi:hypothetical protein
LHLWTQKEELSAAHTHANAQIAAKPASSSLGRPDK